MSRPGPLRRLAAGLAVLVSLAACSALTTGGTTTIGNPPYEEGSGKVATETRTVDAFHAISASQGVVVSLSIGPSPSVAVTADDNLLPHVTTELRDGTLVVGVNGSIRTNHELKVAVTAASIDRIGASAGAIVNGLDLAGDLAVDANSGAIVRGGGKVDALDVSVDAGGTADLRNVEARVASVRLTTGSVSYVNVKESVTGTCGSGSTLHVHGGADATGVSRDSSASVKEE